ncbi:MAG TPA: IclR family transcriptional regulator [Bosea sp. (in: a-proteobacteria)]|jgi:IclR family acetate operon transcriptional repressor|uniref:HTH-type transcriptional regulator BhcR n=1 Tax=Bosea sp. (in: a-proteobacteria) TaxID=1871050 RepID=UPI002E0D4F33|nr:HTH-type transcriptional regulator BhcR [Bosea sp. (in: a-proteobacteria)]HEV7337435.1 IclR family transcriptional regulator [Bosea sp. (in: a-proteobacteria)]
MSAIEQRKGRGRPRSLKAGVVGGAVQALDRGLTLLEILAEEDGLTLSELSRRSGVSASTVHRILLTLESRAYVQHDMERGIWLVGVGAFKTGSAFLRNRRVASMGRAAMHALMEATGETVNLGIEDDGEVVFISQIESHDTLRAFFRAGSRGAMHASGVGKALLAEFPEHRVRQICAVRRLKRFTEHTITDLGELLSELAQGRRNGWALDDEERSLGMRCVAAPIFNEHAEAIAGVSVSGPAVRVTPRKLDDYGPMVRRAADEITRSIGGRLPKREEA